MSSNEPIGLLDSGLGGLSVMSAIRAEFPHENLIYAADCGHAPWGNRDDTFIAERVDAVVEYLLSRKIKALVRACNTATAVSAERLRARLSIPVVGIEPAVLPAARATRTKVFGVMATVKTIESERYQRLKHLVEDPAIQILDCPCPGLMECVEDGAFNTPETRSLIASFVEPLLEKNIDQLVLGCTHYPFLHDAIGEVAGPGVALINPAPAVARHLRTVLADIDALASRQEAGTDEYFVTGANALRERVLQTLTNPAAKLQNLDV